jgi:predicted phage terminase large subunit-like protein
MTENLLELRGKLLGSFLMFTCYFFKQRTGKDFLITNSPGREPFHFTVSKQLTRAFNLDAKHIIINIPPGHGKSEFLIHFIAWAMARYPDSNFLYISHTLDLATKHTYTIRQIMTLPMYKHIFGVSIASDSNAKDNFRTSKGGIIRAFGSSGAVVGQDAGLPHLNRFSGCVVMDDMHNPDDVHSDTIRARVIRNYQETIVQRPRGENVPMIFIGQRLHEDDLPAFMLSGKDEFEWERVVLKSLDDHGNPLYPEFNSRETLMKKREVNAYTFSGQFQQDPIPAGGALFKPEWFKLLDEEPAFLCTFITADTAETEKSYNDASVFTFLGLYKIKQFGVETELYGLHIIDCLELRVEPKDLKDEFMQFYAGCMRHKTKPTLAAIEKKSTGVTLVSILGEIQGLQVLGIERTAASRSKSDRFIEMQQYIASKLISLPTGKTHTKLVIDHMSKITANNTHRFDDIADTLYDAIKISLIDKTILYRVNKKDTSIFAKELYQDTNRLDRLKGARSWQM